MTERFEARKARRETITRRREIIKCIAAVLITAISITLGFLGKLHPIFVIAIGAMLFLWLDK